MNSGIFGSIELNKILLMLAEYAGTEMVRQKIINLVPLEDERMIREALTETAEGVSVILYKGSMPIGHIEDIKGVLEMAKKCRTLSMKELISVRISLKVARELKKFLSEDVPKTKYISEIKNLIELIPALENEIERSIISENEIADTASQELSSIRRNIRNKNEQIRSKLSGYKASGSKFMQDDLVTVRNGRYVVPVKKEFVQQVPGLIQDRSQSGATVFIEPQAIVELNNDLKELRIDEEIEIERILGKLSEDVANHYYELFNNQNLIEKLDFINAKSRLSVSMDAVNPKINNIGQINIISGRHPLIDKDKVVPVDIVLGKDFKTLLITGPNTGGKTVTLKTIGLFSLMIKCGLHIPCYEGSEMAIFKDIYVDIGDEQSIEQSLSTFSSHMKRIVYILENATDSSIVLLDELGAGTDPAEGAALGVSILESLRKKGSIVAATTHYTELKKYAIENDDVENASMEFNIKTLSPTYKLKLGLPGKSNAFEISERLGLPESIIDRAKALLDENELSFENAVNAIEDNKIRTEEELRIANEIREEALIKMNEADQHLKETLLKREEIIAEARKEALEIISDTRKSGEEIILELKKKEDSQTINITSKASDTRRKLKDLEKKNRVTNKKSETNHLESLSLENARPGMSVKAVKLGQNGVIEKITENGKKARVRIGAIKMDISLNELIPIDNNPPGNKIKKKRTYNSIGNIYKSKAESISPEINVIGKNLEEAISVVEKYLDDSLLSGLKTVTIIHGRGEGTLRQGIREMLKGNTNVKSFENAPYNAGGDGATVVHMKE